MAFLSWIKHSISNTKMETWLIIIILVSLCICFVLHFLFPSRRLTNNLPPGPPSFPIFTSFSWLRRSSLEMESLLRSYVAKYGPVVTLPIGHRLTIFIADRSIAHMALVQNGALFADRPPALPLNNILSSNQHNINSASYGSLWRLLRRNLTSEILHLSRVKSYTRARKWVLDILLNRLLSQSESGTPVCVDHHFRYAMFCLLVLMCFGDKLNDTQVHEIENVVRTTLINLGRFYYLNFWPKLTKIFLRKHWEAFLQVRRNQDKVLIPLIEARRKAKQERANRDSDEGEEEEFVVSYVDTLLDLELTDEKRKLTEEEIVTLSSEFLNAGTDTTSTALQWIMANLVKYPDIQHKLFAEIKGVMGDGGEEVKEEDLGKLPYLRAVVLEGLRRHPPVHVVLPHAVKEDTTLENYVIPKNGTTVNFLVAEMGWDPKVWEDPMVFKPERFMKGGEEVAFDITGSKEIKMMPFGAGRRMCPGLGLAMLHLEYFIANMIWRFEWKAVDGGDVDLSEKIEIAVVIVMEKPLKANIRPRFKK